MRQIDYDFTKPTPRWFAPAIAAGLLAAVVFGTILAALLLATKPETPLRAAPGAGATPPASARPAQDQAAPPAESAPEPPPILLNSSAELWWAYDGNEAVGDAKFTGKVVQFAIRGAVIKKDGQYTIDTATLSRVICEVIAADVDKLALVQGKPWEIAFLVRGVCAGREGVPLNQGGNGHKVKVQKCRILGAAQVVADGNGGDRWVSAYGDWTPPQ